MLEISNYGTLIIIKPLAPLTLPHAVALQKALERELLMPGIRDVVLDLAEVTEVDGSGLGAVVHAATAARSSGQRFYMYRPAEIVLHCLRELDIAGFFPMLEHEEDLLAHLPD